MFSVRKVDEGSLSCTLADRWALLNSVPSSNGSLHFVVLADREAEKNSLLSELADDFPYSDLCGSNSLLSASLFILTDELEADFCSPDFVLTCVGNSCLSKGVVNL